MELETERLVLRFAIDRDAGEIADYFVRNRERLARWDPQRPAEFYTSPWWRERVVGDARLAAEDRGYRLVMLAKAQPARVAGFVHFANVVRGAFHSCHLGFSIDGQLEGKGAMREALERAIAWAFDDLRLHRIEANHRPENMRSARLLRRLAFVPQGYARDYLFIDGEWRDHVLTARINERWSPRADVPDR